MPLLSSRVTPSGDADEKDQQIAELRAQVVALKAEKADLAARRRGSAGGDDGSAQCASHGTKAHPVQCDLECVEGCFWPPWETLSTTPCFRECGVPLLLLAILALLW